MGFERDARDTEGIVSSSTPREHLRAVATLAALHLLRVSFYVHARDEGGDGVKQWSFDDLAGEHPKVSGYWLGVELAAAIPDYDISVHPTDLDLDDEVQDTWRWLVRQQYSIVTDTLLDVWGDNELFCALWTSSGDEPSCPVPDSVMHEILNGDETMFDLEDRMPAWMWLTGGMAAAD